MTTWTIRADDVLDKLVEENIRILGYTSKAELIREAVREFILQRNLGRLGLLTLDDQRREAREINPSEAIERLRSLTSDQQLIDRVVKEERAIIEQLLLKFKGAGND